MLIVSDTSPLHYLILIRQIDLLPKLFRTILIPPAVVAELSHENPPYEVKEWMKFLPDWLKVASPSAKAIALITGIDKGESEAIALAGERNADAILLDDRRGVREAVKRAHSVISTLGVLELGASRNLVDLNKAIADLSLTNFWLPAQDVIDEILDRNS